MRQARRPNTNAPTDIEHPQRRIGHQSRMARSSMLSGVLVGRNIQLGSGSHGDEIGSTTLAIPASRRVRTATPSGCCRRQTSVGSNRTTGLRSFRATRFPGTSPGMIVVCCFGVWYYQGEGLMNRFRRSAVAGALITLVVIASACTSTSQRDPNLPLNSACALGFDNDRPSEKSCPRGDMSHIGQNVLAFLGGSLNAEYAHKMPHACGGKLWLVEDVCLVGKPENIGIVIDASRRLQSSRKAEMAGGRSARRGRRRRPYSTASAPRRSCGRAERSARSPSGR